ncbi:PH-domain-containing protein [Rhizopus microsporus var. microsporus]|uniref:PH-domain-containing protein n=1 Tax=Rhizopus microsporus var. microsporus TaxID=86635 RepID=A0A1X0R6E5_RHIZD|nr:PH-domain-containing protein [Rhizopus microsporus var. microsporus]
MMTASETVYAIHNFEAENDDELNFYIGEPIIVLQKDDGFNDGWWKGQNVRGEVGLFPVNYVSCHDNNLPTPSSSSNTRSIKSSSDINNNNLPVSSTQLKRSVIQSLSHPSLKSILPEYWNIDQVEIWLNAIDFGSIAAHFKDQEITGDILIELNMNSLKELDVPTFGKRFKLHAAISVLREECYPSYKFPSSQSMTSDNSSFMLKRREEGGDYAIMPSNKNREDHVHPMNGLNHLSFAANQPTVLPMDHHMYSTPTEETITPDMEGWLHKQGCRYKKWNKRWFVLKGPNLFYFKSPKDVRMKGIINLRGYRVIPDESIQPGKYSFKAQHEEERTFYFYTDEESSMKAWMTSLMKATISRDLSAPVLSSRVIPTVSLEVARRMRPRPPSVLLYKPTKLAYEPSFITEQESSVNQDSGFDSDLHPTAPPSSIEPSETDEEEDEGIEQDAKSWSQPEFIEWVNTICPDANISSLKEIRRDNILAELLQELSGQQILLSYHESEEDKIANVFEFMKKEGISGVDEFYTVEDVCQGNEDKIIIMLRDILEWSI